MATRNGKLALCGSTMWHTMYLEQIVDSLCESHLRVRGTSGRAKTQGLEQVPQTVH